MKSLIILGQRMQQLRTAAGLKQKELADQAALSVDTISALENGRPVTTESLQRALHSLGYSQALADMLPEPIPSPIELAKRQGKQRQRVR